MSRDEQKNIILLNGGGEGKALKEVEQLLPVTNKIHSIPGVHTLQIMPAFGY